MDKKFDKLLSESLGELGMATDMTGEAQSKLSLVNDIKRELESAQDHVMELKTQLRHAIEDFNIELAKALRRRVPKLNVNLSDGRCSASYKSTNLSCCPDLESNMWSFTPNHDGRRFSRKYGTALKLDNTVDPLVDAIVQYFGRYKTL